MCSVHGFNHTSSIDPNLHATRSTHPPTIHRFQPTHMHRTQHQHQQVEAMAKKLAMHVVAAGPMYLSPDDVPADVQTREKDVARQTVRRVLGVGLCSGGMGGWWNKSSCLD